jgi:twitching motility two-component system response regulator PilH
LLERSFQGKPELFPAEEKKGETIMAEKRILLVTNSQAELDMLNKLLGRFDYEIVSASSGEECIDKACSKRPDLIILDVFIPKKNGFAACKILKSKPDLAKIPVILLTSSKKDFEDFWGADIYMSRPFKEHDLLKAVFHFLSKHLLFRYEREERRRQRRSCKARPHSTTSMY